MIKSNSDYIDIIPHDSAWFWLADDYYVKLLALIRYISKKKLSDEEECEVRSLFSDIIEFGRIYEMDCIEEDRKDTNNFGNKI